MFYPRASFTRTVLEKWVIFLAQQSAETQFHFFFDRSEAQHSAQCLRRHPYSSCVISWIMLRCSVCVNLLLSALIHIDILWPQDLEHCVLKMPIIWFLGGRNSGRSRCLTLAKVLWRHGHQEVMKRWTQWGISRNELHPSCWGNETIHF